MNLIKKIFIYINNLFKKKKEVAVLEDYKKTIRENQESSFNERLKVDISINRKKKIETLICDGDGLGIKSSISS